MILILKKKLYNSLSQQKKLHTLNTYNRIIKPYNYNIELKTQMLYTIYIITKEKHKYSLKEITGILIKKNKMQNLTNLHLLCLKRYNNIYISLFKESPNIIIKYKI